MLVAFKRSCWILGVAVAIAIVFLPGYTKLQELKDKNHDLEDKIKRLNRENRLLEEELVRIANDPVYREKLARDKMGLVRKGEIPIKILPQQEE